MRREEKGRKGSIGLPNFPHHRTPKNQPTTEEMKAFDSGKRNDNETI
jgi:hypothetical protein